MGRGWGEEWKKGLQAEQISGSSGEPSTVQKQKCGSISLSAHSASVLAKKKKKNNEKKRLPRPKPHHQSIIFNPKSWLLHAIGSIIITHNTRGGETGAEACTDLDEERMNIMREEQAIGNQP